MLCRLVECIALARLPLTQPQHKQLHASIDENLRHPTASIQSAACSALAAFAATYIPNGDADSVQRTSDRYLGLLTDPNVAARRGAAAALGVLPSWLLKPLSRQILAGLASATEVKHAKHRNNNTMIITTTLTIQQHCYQIPVTNIMPSSRS